MSERPFSQVAKPLIVAHRGASVEEAENTLEAFDLAVSAGTGAVEFDVRITADGHAVVMHDPTLDRTTDGTGLVSSHTLAEVRALRITLTTGQVARVPTLAETLELLSGRAAVDVEIKNIPGEPDFDAERELGVEAVHRCLDEVAFVGDVIVSSFNPLSIAASRAARPEIPTGLLAEYRVEAAAALRFAADQGHTWVLPFVTQVLEAGPRFPGEVHDAGLFLGTWITDDPAEAVALGNSGVDAVATNDPRRVVAAVTEAARAVIGRRKELPAELRASYEAFHAVLDEIEPAKAGLADVLPSTRLPGRPLNDAVGEYRTRLLRATTTMAAWRRPEVDDVWRACSDGLSHGIERATRLLDRDVDPPGFEGLLGTVEQLMDPLDPFAAAEERFRALRRRPRREN